MITLWSAVAAIVPMVLYLMIIWRLDKYDREPLSFLLKNFFYGAFGSVVIAIAVGYLFAPTYFLFRNLFATQDRYEVVFLSPVLEEITKGAFLFTTVSSRKFDNLTDGLVYGGAIGLGFGMTENFLYFISNSSDMSYWITLIAIRSLFSGVMHCVTTGLLGAALGLAKFKPLKSKLVLVPLGLFIAIAIHIIWNSTVTSSDYPKGFLFMFCAIISFILLFKHSLRTECGMIYHELYEEYSEGLIPVEHLNILSSPLREKKGWVDELIRRDYISTATSLAFRKMQFRNSQGLNKEYYEREILIQRSHIQKLFQKINLI